MDLKQQYNAFMDYTKEVHALGMAEEWLSWDQQTKMPSKGADARAIQISVVSGLAHEMLISGAMADHLGSLESANLAELGSEAVVNVREMRRYYDRGSKIPTDLVKEISKTASLATDAWIKAREESNFSLFSPWLQKMLDLKKQAADAVGWTDKRYDALHDEFEPGSTSKRVAEVFAKLRGELVPLVEQILASPLAKDRKAVPRVCPMEQQRALGRKLLTAIGFDWEAGRIDVSAHPFCSGNMHDVRLTTRYDENDLTKALFGLLHEGGHGLYEQGYDPTFAGSPMASAVSLGIHESQSLTWENLVGRSRGFWDFAYPIMQKHFPGTFDSLSVDDWYAETNRIERSLIRVEADEVTYPLHVILRFELEMDLFEDRLEVKDIPDAWNAKMEEFLGITPENDAVGCLQDIHWSHGIFGYFPTYALGYLYGAQFWATARKALPDWEDQFRKGNFAPLLEWLRENIHRQGKKHMAHELVEVVTGEPLDSRFLIEYLREKYSPLYDL